MVDGFCYVNPFDWFKYGTVLNYRSGSKFQSIFGAEQINSTASGESQALATFNAVRSFASDQSQAPTASAARCQVPPPQDGTGFSSIYTQPMAAAIETEKCVSF